MKASLDASICSPHKCPATAEIDPTELRVTAAGKPQVALSPTALELPGFNLETRLKVTVTLPEVVLEGTDRLGGIVGGLLGSQGNLVTELVGLFTNGGSLEEIAKIRLSDLKVEVEPFRASLGRLALHGIAEDAQHKPSTMAVDLDALDARALFKGLKAQLKGCLVLNGGEDCCAPKAEKEPPYNAPPGLRRPGPTPAVLRVKATKEGRPIVVEGTGFGSDPGRVIVIDATSQRAPVVQSWTDTRIEALPSPVIPRGDYFLQVQTADGQMSAAVPFHID